MRTTTKRAGEKEQEQVLPPTTIGKRKAQAKPSKTRTKPQASSSTAPPKNRNDKQKVVEPSDLEDESENEESPSTSPKKTIKKKPSTKPPTSSQRLTKLKSIPFAPTRYPDLGFLQDAGLLEDVQDIFTNLGLGQFFTMAYPTYVNPTREFLASLKVQFYDAREARANNDLGYFEFRVGGTLHKMTFKELGDIYNFQAGDELEFSGCSGEYLSFWRQIGTGKLKKGATKASTIAHPAIRYAHKVLSHTLFARRETGNVLEEEVICLLAGLQPILKELTPGTPITTSARNTCVAAVFVRQLLHYQEWAWTTTDSTPVLSMGGLVTPILKAKGIALTNIDHEIVRIDPIYLKKSLFLAGRTERNLYVYQGRCSTSRMSAKVLLPNVPITSLRIDGNHHFYVSDVHHYDVDRDGVLLPIRKGRRGEISEPSSPPHPPSPVYGQARYDFKPYDEAIADKALRKAHTHIHLLQKFVKWQGRTIEKLVKGVKNLNGKVKTLEKLSQVGCSNTTRHENQPNPMEVDANARHSFNGTNTQEMVLYDASRASSYERRQRRKRRATHSPTPSPASSNSSYSFSTSWD